MFDYHTPDHADQAPPDTPVSLQKIDPVAIAEAAKRAGVDSLVFYAKDNQGNFYYPTELGHQLSDLKGRDLVQEFIDALRPRGIKAVAYFQPIRDRRTFEENPAWRQVLNDGSEWVEQPFLQQGRGGHHMVCPLGGGGEAALEQLRELVIRYELDGVWWDRAGGFRGTAQLYPCLCQSCQEQFRRETGLEIPREADWDSQLWRTFWQWRAGALLRFQKRAQEIVHRYGKGACLLSNYAYYGMVMVAPIPQTMDMEAASDATDVASLEAQHWSSQLSMSINPRLMSALTDRPCEILLWRVTYAGDGVVRSYPPTEAALHTILAHGHAAVFLDMINNQGEVDARTMPMVKAVFSRFRKLEPYLDSAHSLRYAAVLFSPATYMWYGKNNPDQYAKEFVGTIRQMLQLHVPFEIISDRHLTAKGLEGLRLLVLPNAACLSDEACGAIRDWVQKGGVLVASYESSRFDKEGSPRGDFGLAKVLGVSYAGAADGMARWMKARRGMLADLGWHEFPVALRGASAYVECHEGTEVLADMGTPLPGFDIFSFLVNPTREWGPYPAVTHRSCGNGHSIYIAGNLGAIDLQWGVAELTVPLKAALRLAQLPPVWAGAPSSVELIGQELENGDWLVHLVNLQGEAGRTHRMPTLAPMAQGISEVIPVRDVAIFTSKKVRAAREILEGKKMRAQQNGDGSKIVLPKLEVTACILLESM
jgi:hypothetical protein